MWHVLSTKCTGNITVIKTLPNGRSDRSSSMNWAVPTSFTVVDDDPVVLLLLGLQASLPDLNRVLQPMLVP